MFRGGCGNIAASLRRASRAALPTCRALASFSRSEIISASIAAVVAWLDEWVYGLEDFGAYVSKIGQAHFDKLKPEPYPAPSVDYGRYR